MQIDDCYLLGEVIKTHGLNGEVSVFLDVDLPESYKNLESVFLKQEGILVPFFIETLQINGDRALVKFEDVESLNEAKEFVKSELYLPLASLPKLPDGGYYFHELVGCVVHDSQKEVGVVKNVLEFGNQQLLEIENENKEHLIPLTDGIIKETDIPNKRIIVSLPEGLLDL